MAMIRTFNLKKIDSKNAAGILTSAYTGEYPILADHWPGTLSGKAK
jgi:hypothetical protein